jgi:beta-lactamase regulating signal transducer with metallopeptidase domain
MIDPATILNLIANHLWQSALLAGSLWGLLFARRLLSAQARHTLAFAALIASAALPLAMLLPGNELLMQSISSSGERAIPMRLDAAEIAPARAAGADPEIIALRSVERAAELTPSAEPVPDVVAEAKPTAKLGGFSASAAWGSDPGSLSVSLAPTAIESLPAMRLTAAVEPQPEPSGLAATIRAWSEAARDALASPLVVWSLFALWLVGAAVLLARTGVDALAAERLRARAAPVALPRTVAHLIGELDVRESAEAPGPMVAGLVRPTIILPLDLLKQRTDQELLGLVAHERAHIERGDLTLALVQRIVIALAWWSPAMHWIAARVEEEREMACDEAAAARVGDARAFARALTAHAEAQLFWGWPRLVVGATRGRSLLGRRVRRLLEIAGAAAPPAGIAGRLCAGALLAVIAAAALATPRLEAQDADTDDDDRSYTVRPTPAPRAPSAPRVLIAPDAPVVAMESRDMRRLTRELTRAEARMSRAAERLDEAVDDLEDDPSRAADVRRAADDLAEAQEDLRSAAAELEAAVSSMAGAAQILDFSAPGVRVNVASPTQPVEVGRAAEGLADAITAMVGDLDVAVEVDTEAMGGLKGLAALGQLGNWNYHYAGWNGAMGGPEARPLMLAAQMGDLEMVELLVDAGADVNAAAGRQGSVLTYAVQSGEVELARFLLDHGADPNQTVDGQVAPLMTAVQTGEAEMVDLLLDAGADPDARSPLMGTALMAAVRMGESEIARLLIDAGADVEGVRDEDPEED